MISGHYHISKNGDGKNLFSNNHIGTHKCCSSLSIWLSITAHMTSTAFPCVSCANEVRPRQQALQCDACDGWQHRTWSPQDWSVYGQAVRTNNDVEGYHRRINGNASSSHIPFYVLVQLLYRESQHVKLQVRLVKDGKLARYQRRVYRQLQGRLFSLWDKYERHDITTTHLLSTAARIYGPTAITQ